MNLEMDIAFDDMGFSQSDVDFMFEGTHDFRSYLRT
jgi:hypothetical protein